jgi:hypothetical protein
MPKTLVLVHGGFVDGSGWQGVHDALTADGYRVAIGVNAAGGAISEASWRIKPSWYLVASDDHMIPPPAQRAMADRTGPPSPRFPAVTRSTCPSPRPSPRSSSRPRPPPEGSQQHR